MEKMSLYVLKYFTKRLLCCHMKKTYFGIAVIACLVLVFVYLGASKNTVKQEESIKIATILSETGIAAAFGENTKLGAELAVEEINSKGGINGRVVELISENDQTDPKIAVGLYKKVTSVNGADAIIGSNFDFVVNALFEEAKKNNTIVVAPMAPRIAGAIDTSSNSFTMLSDFSEIVNTLDGYLTNTPYTKMAVIHYSSAFGTEITKTINNIAEKNGKEAVIEEMYSEFGIGDWTPYILKMKKDGVDLVFVDMVGTDFLNFATQAERLGLEAQLVTHMDVREGLKDAGKDISSLEGTVVLNWDVLGDNASFNRKFTEKYGREADHFAAQAYAAVYVLANAVSHAESKAEIPQILENGTFETPIGAISFTENHTSETKVAVQIIKDGKLTPLE